MNGQFAMSRVHKPESGVGLRIPLRVGKGDASRSFYPLRFAPLPGNPEGALQTLAQVTTKLTRYNLADEAIFIPCDRAGTIEVHVEHVDVHRKGCSNSVIEAMMNRELPPAWAGLIPVNEVARRSVQHVIAFVITTSLKYMRVDLKTD